MGKGKGGKGGGGAAPAGDVSVTPKILQVYLHIVCTCRKKPVENLQIKKQAWKKLHLKEEKKVINFYQPIFNKTYCFVPGGKK